MIAAFLVVTALAGSAPDALKEAADRYAKGDALAAADAYETAVREGADSADVWFNLGTAALRGGDVGRAIWALLEARSRAPWDEDTLFNLELARRENVDTLVGHEEPAWLSLMWFVPRAPLQWLAFACLLLLCVFITARGMFGPHGGLTRLTFRVGLITLVLGVLTVAVELTAGAPTAVIVVKEAIVRSTERSDGPEAFRVHSGLTVRPTTQPRNGLVRIRLSNGLEGFVDEKALRFVKGPARAGAL